MAHHSRGFSFFVVLSLAIASAAFAAKPVSDTPMTIGDVNVSASAIQWQASGGFDRLVLLGRATCDQNYGQGQSAPGLPGR